MKCANSKCLFLDHSWNCESPDWWKECVHQMHFPQDKPAKPPKPSAEWLKKHGVELTGVYRTPNVGEKYVAIDPTTREASDVGPLTWFIFPGITAPADENNPRWILRDAAPGPAPPPQRPDEWLRENRVERTGECRKPVAGEQFEALDEDANPGPRWILRAVHTPPQHSDAWLKRHHVERTGECRAPEVCELFEALDADGKPGAGSPLSYDHGGAARAGPRWILRLLPAEPDEKEYPVSRGEMGLQVDVGNDFATFASVGSPDNDRRTCVGFRMPGCSDLLAHPVAWKDSIYRVWPEWSPRLTPVVASTAVFRKLDSEVGLSDVAELRGLEGGG